MPPGQLSFPALRKRTRHGHGVRDGRRKEARPLAPKTPLHITFRSQKARGALSFLHPNSASRVQSKTQELAHRFDVRIHQYANAGNHLHLLIEGRTRKGLQDFLRAMGARIAGLVTGARKGQPFGQFWDGLVFSRLVSRGRDFTHVCWYILRNHLESLGVVDHERGPKNRRRTPGAGVARFPKEWATRE